jgi:Holliday junction resolvase RusA-like endonuclease
MTKLRKQSKAYPVLIITIPNYITPSRNKTITKHWRTYMVYRDEIAELIKHYTPTKQLFERAIVTIYANYKDNRRRDVSNIDDKLIIDGLMHAKILKDDSSKENPCVVKWIKSNAGSNKLVVIVKGV